LDEPEPYPQTVRPSLAQGGIRQETLAVGSGSI
jgi:hypothetical protein